jgi:Txe/YoeB family toxin of Txe-Axe toxin-antitoxin module
MPRILNLRDDLEEYIRKQGLTEKWQQVKHLFENDPSHPSLHTELLEPKQRLIYSFRIDKKYRAIFIVKGKDLIEIISITKHYRKQ